MTLTEQEKSIRKEFRKYLREVEGQKGYRLNALIKAAEENLPTLIKQHVRKDFHCLFDDVYSIEELISISSKLKNDEEILIAFQGHISSKAIDAYVRFYASKYDIDLKSLNVPNNDEQDSLEEEKHQIEGRLTEAKVLRRQRNRNARQKCLEASNYTCYVCGFNFEKVYGEIGKGFIEVHHKTPLSEYDEEHEIPQSELCALCSNCHSMVHRNKKALDVDELKRIYLTSQK